MFLGMPEELLAIKSLFQYQEERLIISAMERLIESSPSLPWAEASGEFKPSSLLDHIMAELEDRGEYQEARFQGYWTPERVGRILTRMSIFKRGTAEGIRYTITEAKLRELKTRYEPSPTQTGVDSVGSVGGVGFLEGLYGSPLSSLTKLYDMEMELQSETLIKTAETVKGPIKQPQQEDGKTPEIPIEIQDMEGGSPIYVPEKTYTTYTTYTKPPEGPIQFTPVEEAILKTVELEGSIGILLLKQQVESELSRRLEAEEFQGILRNLEHRGLIHMGLETVSIPGDRGKPPRIEPQPSLTIALGKLSRLSPGEEFSPVELSSLFGWPEGFAERVIRVAERESLMFRTSSGRWRRSLMDGGQRQAPQPGQDQLGGVQEKEDGEEA